MKKKLFALFLAVLTFCGLAGCSYSVDSEPSFTQSPVSSPTAYTPEPATPVPTLEPPPTMTERATQTPEKTQKKQQQATQKPKKTQSTKTEDKTGTVYITDTGDKYHRSGCRYLKKSKHAISLSNAKAQGYTPCSVCKP